MPSFTLVGLFLSNLNLHSVLLPACGFRQQEMETDGAESCFLVITTVIQSNVSQTPVGCVPRASVPLFQSCCCCVTPEKKMSLVNRVGCFLCFLIGSFQLWVHLIVEQKQQCAETQLIPFIVAAVDKRGVTMHGWKSADAR